MEISLQVAHQRFKETDLKNSQPPGGHIFQETGTIFELVEDIIGTNLLTMFHDDRTVIMASRVFRRKNATPPWGPCIIGKNRLAKFHDNRTINVASRVLIRKNAPPLFHEDRKNKCGLYYTRKNAPPPGGHVFQPISIIFELVQDIVGMNLLTKFNEDQIKNVAPIVKNAFQANITIFKLIQDIIETNLLTKFHEDWTINVASRELSRQMLTPHNARQTKDDHKSST
ncbi:hypothetical protein DPMN_118008 [Dreissena polymorpha]|uniref:Uncharacterized protein n=1 Tax=Dreissena polymorpha TaxID=45954 RepID=A0A9D4GGL2_DREPO|nr:hypothetical protein DPMN_118008 [Dreissena polymorpha]